MQRATQTTAVGEEKKENIFEFLFYVGHNMSEVVFKGAFSN